MRRRLAWWISLAAALVLLSALGRGRLALPAPWHSAALLARVRADGAELAALAGLRLLLIVAGAWLVALSLLAEAARLPGLGPVARRLLRLPLPGRRSVLWKVLGAPAVAVGITGATMASAVAQPSGPPVAVWVGPPPSATPAGAPPSGRAGEPVPPSPPGDAPVLHLLPAVPPPPSPAAGRPAPTPPTTARAPHPEAADPAAPARRATPGRTGPGKQRQSPLSRPSSTLPPTTDAPRPPTPPPPASPATPAQPPPAAPPQAAPAAPPQAAPAAPPEAAPEAPASTYTLVAGDHLWAVATKTLTARLGRPPEQEVLAHYWWQLVEANRSRLPDPSNPDYVRPGLTVVLP